MKRNDKKKRRLKGVGLIALILAIATTYYAAAAYSFARSGKTVADLGFVQTPAAESTHKPERLSGTDLGLPPDPDPELPADHPSDTDPELPPDPLSDTDQPTQVPTSATTAEPTDMPTEPTDATTETPAEPTTMPTTAPTSATGTTTTRADDSVPLVYRTSRLGGANRVETAIATAKRGWQDGSQYALLANAYSYADALAGVPLAGDLKAPILLTGGKTLESSVLEQLRSMKTRTVYVLGGTAVVSEEIENAIRDAGIRAVRLSGETRFSTAVRISEECERVTLVKPENVFIASAANYPDALSAGAAAASVSGVMLYSAPSGKLDNDTAAYIMEKGKGNIYVLGGKNAIAEEINNQIMNLRDTVPERVAGADRYATALAVCDRFADSFSGNDAVIATGDAFPDALSGGALAAKLSSPVILANNRSFDTSVYEFIKKRLPNTIFVMGGENALSDYAVRCLLTNEKITTAKNTTTTAYSIKPSDPPSGKTAYLTFDDGPSGNTPKILDILDKYNAKATFFVIYHPNYEKYYKEILDRGHTLALHSYTHDYAKIYKSDKAFWDDYKKMSDYIAKVTGGFRPNIMRFPGGASNTISRKYCKGVMTKLTSQTGAKGYRYFDWSVDSGDASGNKVAASKLIANVKRGVGSQKYPNILMHDAAAKTTTVDALPEIIKFLKDNGYQLKNIDEHTPDCHQKVAN